MIFISKKDNKMLPLLVQVGKNEVDAKSIHATEIHGLPQALDVHIYFKEIFSELNLAMVFMI